MRETEGMDPEARMQNKLHPVYIILGLASIKTDIMRIINKNMGIIIVSN